jgi:tetratricopeptide (TPR) repeat protein
MPSEVVQKDNEIKVDAKEIIEAFDVKSKTEENGSQGNKEQSNDILEESKVVDGLSESENKENEEPSDEDIELHKKRAEELLIDGKRHLIIKDFQAAADVLSEACNLFGIVYGEMAEECAEAYFNYGCALLELGKDQISPVGLEEKDEEENEDVSVQEQSLTEADKHDVNNEETNCSSSNNIDEVKDKSTKEEICAVKKNKFDMCKTVEEETSVDKQEKSDEVEEQLTDKEESDGEGVKPDEEDIEEDDVNDLQLAWEMLDLAKVIYKNKDTEEAKLKLAEVLMKCGEVSIEDEKFETAIQDMTESLEIRR